MPRNIECGSGCGRPVTRQSLMQCHLCKSSYHCECLNINLHQLATMSKEYLASWQCPACSNVSNRHRGNRENTPVRSSVIPSVEETASLPQQNRTNADQDWRAFTQELQLMLNGWRNEIDNSLSQISNDIKSALSDMKHEIQTLRTDQNNLKSGFTNLSQEVAELKSSTQYLSKQNEDLEKKVHTLEGHKKDAQESHSLVSTLEYKIDCLEQQARQCNVEIVNVPEKKNENLITILDAIGSVIKYPIQQKDVVSIHRVPHAHQQNNKPKNVIVKFSARSVRDNVLSAYRKMKKVRSDQIGISGHSQDIYLNEHLTLKNKTLFRQCREEAKKCNYKYVWVKNATILVRQNDNSPAFAVRSCNDFVKFKCSLTRMET
ncbi:uncharacterized protein LOC112046443 [Bicyclus anynana]|uniref:Uncharacterized protein LOC112046443 n=1 Tax=Bicyclus anynana TaxID=110368 RepID=A0A6J1MW97_BICAN|nr:uncharacterized protein LOC112046443 [Bicyclus anynana]